MMNSFETVAEAYAKDEKASSNGIGAAFLAGAKFGALRTANQLVANATRAVRPLAWIVGGTETAAYAAAFGHPRYYRIAGSEGDWALYYPKDAALFSDEGFQTQIAARRAAQDHYAGHILSGLIPTTEATPRSETVCEKNSPSCGSLSEQQSGHLSPQPSFGLTSTTDAPTPSSSLSSEDVELAHSIYNAKIAEYDRDFSGEKVTGDAWREKYGTNLHATYLGEQWAMRQAIEAVRPTSPSSDVRRYQDRVADAHSPLFDGDPTDIPERTARFMEEANETCQAFGMTRKEAHALVDYTYGRPAGDPFVEIGSAMLTLTSLCVVAGADLMAAAEADLENLHRPENIARIRRKRSNRHGRGPLPGVDPIKKEPGK